MTKALQTFKDTKLHYDEILQSIVVEITDLQVKLAQAQGQYQDAILKQLEANTMTTKNNVQKARKNIESIQEEIDNASERKQIATRIRNENLQEIFPLVTKEYSQYQQEMNNTIREEAKELKKLRAGFLLKVKSLHDKKAPLRNLYNDIDNIASDLGVKFPVRYTAPSLSMTSTYFGIDEPHAPIPGEVDNAYDGRLDHWVLWFEKTGQVIRNEEARQNLLKEGELK